MAIEGINKEKKEFSDSVVKRVGLFEARVIAINPNEEEYLSILGKTLKEDSKATEYLGKSKNDNTFLRLDVWLQDIKNISEEDKSAGKYKVTFFLENKERENKDFTKKQCINSLGTTTWAEDEDNLPAWFAKRESRVAFIGEEDLYRFLKIWLGGEEGMKLQDPETTLSIDWKKLMKGNVKELKEQIDGNFVKDHFVALATIIIKEKEGDVKEYQGVFNKAFLPSYALKQFRLTDYRNPTLVEKIKKIPFKEKQAHEKFISEVAGDYGCKDYYTFRDIQNYDSSDNFAASDEVMASDDSEY
jgi:hypothetical protein